MSTIYDPHCIWVNHSLNTLKFALKILTQINKKKLCTTEKSFQRLTLCITTEKVSFCQGIASQYVDIIDWSGQTKCTTCVKVKENEFYTVRNNTDV